MLASVFTVRRRSTGTLLGMRSHALKPHDGHRQRLDGIAADAADAADVLSFGGCLCHLTQPRAVSQAIAAAASRTLPSPRSAVAAGQAPAAETGSLAPIGTVTAGGI